MNMKKTIAGIFAGAVAISAVATTMASAKTVSYAPIDKTFDLKANGYGFKEITGKSISGTVDLSTATAMKKGDKVTFVFSEKVNDVKLTFSSGALASKTYTLSEVGDKDEDGKIYELTVDAALDNADTTNPYAVTFDFDVTALDTVYKYKSEAQKNDTVKNALTVYTVDATNSDGSDYVGLDNAFLVDFGTKDSPVTALAANYTFDVVKATNKYVTITEGEGYESIANWTGDVEDGVTTGEDVVDAISEAIEGRMTANVIFNFDSEDDWVDDDNVAVTVKFVTKDFGILKQTVELNESNYTATIDWGKIVKSATSGLSTLGDISNKLSDIEVAVNSEDEDGKTIDLKSITVKGGSESTDVLSAGESVADTTAAITSATEATTAPATEATTTAAASNPKTGNAPVALAVIPVAIAAAAIIAKKRG
jgi:hypothetical protein